MLANCDFSDIIKEMQEELEKQLKPETAESKPQRRQEALAFGVTMSVATSTIENVDIIQFAP